jgi:hypothetical protein
MLQTLRDELLAPKEPANPRHLSKSQEHYTPGYVIDRIKRVMPIIDLDPASSYQANETVGAMNFFTKDDDALKISWALKPDMSIWLNPPGGKVGNRSLPVLFWQKLMRLRSSGWLGHACFLAFSIEFLQTSQNSSQPAMDFPLVLFRKRLQFVNADGVPQAGNTHSSALIYVPGTNDRTGAFCEAFEDLGSLHIPHSLVNGDAA